VTKQVRKVSGGEFVKNKGTRGQTFYGVPEGKSEPIFDLDGGVDAAVKAAKDMGQASKDALNAFLKGFGMSVRRNGGTSVKPHIMQLPTNSSQRNKK
jgi:hypothetical protein